MKAAGHPMTETAFNPSGDQMEMIDTRIAAAARALIGQARTDGHWCFELETDATISAEYVLMLHYLGEPDPALEAKIAA
jgi:squalene-hopene/tetraprenyl-beta-curcumene cyclase